MSYGTAKIYYTNTQAGLNAAVSSVQCMNNAVLHGIHYTCQIEQSIRESTYQGYGTYDYPPTVSFTNNLRSPVLQNQFPNQVGFMEYPTKFHGYPTNVQQQHRFPPSIASDVLHSGNMISPRGVNNSIIPSYQHSMRTENNFVYNNQRVHTNFQSGIDSNFRNYF